MSYRSLLIPLDNEPGCVALTAAALALRQSMSCHLTGIATTDPVDLMTTLRAADSVATLDGLTRRVLVEQASNAVLRFQLACRQAGTTEFDARVEETGVLEMLLRHVHSHDLTLISQPDPRASDPASALSVIERILLGSSRPLLAIPYANAAHSLGRTVMVAWDGSREASRAVADALPLLRRAGHVHLVAWKQGAGKMGGDQLEQRVAELWGWLKRHEVPALTFVETTTLPIGEALLSRASDFGADLIVMGAYGRSRWAERMLGGATRTLLSSMTVPVLMSH